MNQYRIDAVQIPSSCVNFMRFARGGGIHFDNLCLSQRPIIPREWNSGSGTIANLGEQRQCSMRSSRDAIGTHVEGSLLQATVDRIVGDTTKERMRLELKRHAGAMVLQRDLKSGRPSEWRIEREKRVPTR